MSLRCGRRWGKTRFGVTITADLALKGRRVGWFAPEHKFLMEPYEALVHMLYPVLRKSSEGKGKIETTTGGVVDVWSLDNPLAGLGRWYDLVVFDEAAFAKANLPDVWKRNIRPTLTDRRGRALVMSNTNGEDQRNFFWQVCTGADAANGSFVDYHAPSSANPYLPPDELEELRATSHPLVWLQNFEAEFVNWGGAAFFSRDKMLVDGRPVEYPKICDVVFVVIDTAMKTGRLNDGTAALYVAYTRTPLVGDHPLTILDWDVRQVEGAMLEQWLPSVFARAEELARVCRARGGSLGAMIEDKSSGTVLLQQARNHNPPWPAEAIDSKLTAMGKSERAIDASAYYWQAKTKISRAAFDKTVIYKGISGNHLLMQVEGFRVGNRDPLAEDDLLDTFTYAQILALGGREGF